MPTTRAAAALTICATLACAGHAPAVPGGAAPPDLERGAAERTHAWSAAYRVPGAAPRLVVQLGQHGITSAAFTADSHVVATGDEDAVVVVWDADTGRELRRFPTGDRKARCSDASRMRRPELRFVGGPDALLVDSGDRDAPRLELYDARTGERRWSRDGSTVAVAPAASAAVVRAPYPKEDQSAVVDLATGQTRCELGDFQGTVAGAGGAGGAKGGRRGDPGGAGVRASRRVEETEAVACRSPET